MTQINSRTAHAMFEAAGIRVSYPTAMKRLKEWGLYSQPTGTHGGIIVEKEALERKLQETYRKGTVGRPKGSVKRSAT